MKVNVFWPVVHEKLRKRKVLTSFILRPNWSYIDCTNGVVISAIASPFSTTPNVAVSILIWDNTLCNSHIVVLSLIALCIRIMYFCKNIKTKEKIIRSNRRPLHFYPFFIRQLRFIIKWIKKQRSSVFVAKKTFFAQCS